MIAANISRRPDRAKIFQLYDITIPDSMAEDEFMGWLGDILHEAATERHPDVIRVE